MTRLFTLLTTLFLLAACGKQEPEYAPLTLSHEEVALHFEAGSQATLTLTSELAWSATVEGEGFDVQPLRGERGQTIITITSSTTNESSRRSQLGSLLFREAGRSSELRLGIYQKPTLATQTMLLYMPGRGLHQAFSANIEGIKKAVRPSVPGDGRILVCYQPVNQNKAQLLEIYYDAKAAKVATEVVKEYSTFDAGDPTYVHQLLADAAGIAPAARYGLIIGCHGKAWVPASGGVLKPSSHNAYGNDAWLPVPGAKQTRSFGDAGYELDITELADALREQPFKPEYLIFDDCFMASIEVLYDLRGVVEQVVASPCEIMAAGFPYARMVPWLFTDNGSSYNLYKACWEFWNLYMNDWDTKEMKDLRSNEQSGCLSLGLTSKLDALAEVMKRINSGSKKSYDLNALQSYEGFTRHAFFDLGHYVESMCANAALVSEFKEAMRLAFPEQYRFNTPNFYSAYNGKRNPITSYSGVSISDPTLNSTVQPHLTQNNWYKATHQ